MKKSKKAIIEALRLNQGFISKTAEMLDMSPTNLCNYIRRDAKLQQVRDEVRSKLLDFTENKLIEKIKEGEGWAICFALKCLGKERGYVERLEHTGEGGKELMPAPPLQIVFNVLPPPENKLLKAKETQAVISGPSNGNGGNGNHAN
jgi:hypothetical protein